MGCSCNWCGRSRRLLAVISPRLCTGAWDMASVGILHLFFYHLVWMGFGLHGLLNLFSGLLREPVCGLDRLIGWPSVGFLLGHLID